MSKKPDTIEGAIAIRERLIADFEAHRSRLEDNISSLDNWILATLVAVNGAAVLRVVSAPAQTGFDVRIPSALFVLGVVAATMGAVLRRRSKRAFINSMIELRANNDEWERSIRSGEQSPVMAGWFEAGLSRTMSPFDAEPPWSRGLLTASLLLFVAGCIAVGLMWAPPPPQ